MTKTIVTSETSTSSKINPAIKRVLSSPFSFARSNLLHNSGDNYYYGRSGKSQDYIQARDCYEKAIGLYPLGKTLFRVGHLYEEGLGVEVSRPMAAKYYRQAIETGYLEAREAQEALTHLYDDVAVTARDANAIGCMYFSGNGVVRDYVRALIWFRKAFEKNSEAGYILRNFGLLYEYGHGVDKSIVTAAKYYQQAIDKGYPDAQKDLDRMFSNNAITATEANQVASMYHNGDGVSCDYFKAFRWFEKALEANSEDSCTLRNLGLLYEYGHGVDKSIVTAAKYYQQAIDKGYPDAQKDLDRMFSNNAITATEANQVGSMYHNSDGVSCDYFKAFRWFEKALEANSEDGCTLRNLGFLYEYGHGVDKNTVTAAKYYQQAIGKGYPEAQEDLDRLFSNEAITAAEANGVGCMYYNGEGVPRDYSKAFLWFEKALEADNEDGHILRNLGILHECSHGVDKNIVTAAKYYQRAINVGHAPAQEDLNRILSQVAVSAERDAVSEGLVEVQQRYQQVTFERDYLSKKQALIADNASRITATSWAHLGDDYFFATNGQVKNYLYAKMCYEIALTFDSTHWQSLSSLGILSEHGRGQASSVTVIKSRDYYENAIKIESYNGGTCKIQECA